MKKRNDQKKTNAFFVRCFAALLSLTVLLSAASLPALAQPDGSSDVSDAVSQDNASSDDAVSEEDTSEPEAEQDESVTAAVIADAKPDFKVNSESVYMVNTDADEPITVYSKNETERRAPASLTKIVTALVVLENVDDLSITVTAPGYIYDEFYGIGVSNAGINRGEEVTVKDLLYALMLRSACEAASILADYICPNDIPAFVTMMNEKVKEIGCTETNFVNPHGLDAEGQYTCAKDMSIITQYAMKNEQFAEIACTQSYEMAATNQHSEPRTITHTNYMLSSYYGGSYYYEYVQGIKTGTTNEAGRNLVTIGEKDGYHYLLVTLGAPYRDENGAVLSENYSYIDQKNLYEWAFDTFQFTTVIQESQSLDEVPVEFGENKNYVTVTAKQRVILLLPQSLDTSTILVKAKLPASVEAPVVKGDLVGSADLVLADTVIASVDLIAESDVARSGFAYSMHLIKNFFRNPWVIAACIILAILIVVLAAFIAAERKRRRKEKLRRKFGRKNPVTPKKNIKRNTWR